MGRTISSVFLLLTLVAAASPVYGTTPVHLWSQGFGDINMDHGYSVATDASGNVLVAGSFGGTVDFGGGNLVSAGSGDIFIAKYSSTGAHLWSKSFGSTFDDRAYAVATDGSGNVFVTGYFGGSVSFGGSLLVSAGGADIFVAKFGSTGMHQWSKSFGSIASDYGYSIATDGSGNVLVTGPFSLTVDFGGGPLVSAGGYDIFITKYSSIGTHLWSQRFGGINEDFGLAVATDGSDNVFSTGCYTGTVDFGGGGLTNAGGYDVYVAKYSSTGTHLWSHGFGGSTDDCGQSAATDASGNVFVTGYFSGTVDFGGGNLVSAGAADIFLARYDPSGAHVWSQRFGSSIADNAYFVATDGTGNVLMTGIFQETVDFGGGGLTSAGSYDIFLAKYSPSGTYVWSRQAGSALSDFSRCIAADGTGAVVVTGYFQQSVDFGGGAVVSGGGDDVFLAKYSGVAAEPVITSIADIGNDQGRSVKIRFDRSGGDDASASNPVTHYVAFRRDDAPPATSQASPAAALETGWTEVGSVEAFTNDNYGIDVPTIADSTIALGQYYSHFFIRAATDVPSVYYDSPPDSGYSLDNLAPGVPQNLVYTTGNLSWDESSAADVDYFTVYGANADDFGAATLVDYSVAPAMDVSGSPYTYYFVTATDFSGNEGDPAKVNTLSGVGGTPTSYVLSVSNYPNPFNPNTTVKYTVPSRGVVTVAVYDLRGAHVATLFRGERSAGAYAVEWNGRADTGSIVSSGVYFARIEHTSGTRTKKMVLLK